jgi:hypothetical protein
MQKKICISPSGLGAERQVCIVVALSGGSPAHQPAACPLRRLGPIRAIRGKLRGILVAASLPYVLCGKN